jgi:hypothetical protein
LSGWLGGWLVGWLGWLSQSERLSHQALPIDAASSLVGFSRSGSTRPANRQISPTVRFAISPTVRFATRQFCHPSVLPTICLLPRLAHKKMLIFAWMLSQRATTTKGWICDVTACHHQGAASVLCEMYVCNLHIHVVERACIGFLPFQPRDSRNQRKQTPLVGRRVHHVTALPVRPAHTWRHQPC